MDNVKSRKVFKWKKQKKKKFYLKTQQFWGNYTTL